MKSKSNINAAEELGLTREQFDLLYDKHDGFDEKVNRNRPAHNDKPSFGAFLEEGAEKMITADSELIRKLASL